MKQENSVLYSKYNSYSINKVVDITVHLSYLPFLSCFRCCTDLMDNDLELTVVQGINYNVQNPKDVDTYVRFELPWPSAVRKLPTYPLILCHLYLRNPVFLLFFSFIGRAPEG